MPTTRYKILLVEELDDDAVRFEEALAPLGNFQLSARVRDEQEAITYLRGEGAFADRRRFPIPDILMLNVNTPDGDAAEVLEWVRGRNPRLVQVVFFSAADQRTRKHVEQLGADLHESKTWDEATFERFLHFCGNIADVRRREHPI